LSKFIEIKINDLAIQFLHVTKRMGKDMCRICEKNIKKI